MSVRILTGDCRQRLAELPADSVQCVVTSPPYFGLRDYGTAQWDGGDVECDHRIGRVMGNANKGAVRDVLDGDRTQCKCGAVRIDSQIGLEPTLAAYISTLVDVFREVRRVLRPDGTCWLNLGDSYATTPTGSYGSKSGLNGAQTSEKYKQTIREQYTKRTNTVVDGLKPKDLMMVPARVAIALQEPWERHVIDTIADRAWMAGLVDGEGCFTVQAVRVKGCINESHSVRLQVRMADVEAVERIVAITGFNQVTYDQLPPSYALNGQRAAQQWKISGDRMADIAADLYPYLTVKRKQCLVAWNLQHLRDGQDVGKGKPVGEANMEKRRALHEVMRRLNAREHVDIPSWCKEPTVETEPGWYVRSSIIWAKKNCMPESVTDRPTSSHEHIFLLTKQSRYYYDAEAVRESAYSPPSAFRNGTKYVDHVADMDSNHSEARGRVIKGEFDASGRNQRNVWHLATEPFPEAHFATFPSEIPRRCIKAGTSEKGACAACGAPWVRVVEPQGEYAEALKQPSWASGRLARGNDKPAGYPRIAKDTTTTGWQPQCSCDAGVVPCVVLDPFLGSGTTLLVADQLGRDGIGVELSPEYARMAEKRITSDAPMFSQVEVL
jgi:DNA modification methylase